MSKKLVRTVYIAQLFDNQFMVAFATIRNVYPFETLDEHPRQYYAVTPASMKRLNTLVYHGNAIKTSAHLVPYISLWVTFPPKKPAPVRPVTRFSSYTPKGK